MAELPQELQQQLEEYQNLFKNRTDAYVKKAMELNKKGPSASRIPEPITGWPPYPWINIFIAGPFQVIGYTSPGHFKPSKIIAHGEKAHIFAFVWRNPGPINWIPGTPSACNVLNGRKFQVNFEVVNLTSVMEGPDVKPIRDDFRHECIQMYCQEMGPFPEPREGKPDLYELYSTIDVIGHEQPIAGFTTWIFDPDYDPHWLFFPDVGPHWQYERPMQFMVYKR
jgi:hypothetical protein